MMVQAFTFVHIAEGTSEGSAHSYISILQVLQHQVLHRDRLTVNLKTLTFISGDGAGQGQKLCEQKHMQLLQESKKKSLKHDVLLNNLLKDRQITEMFHSPCHSCCAPHHDTKGSCTARCEGPSACHQDTLAFQCSTDTQTLLSSCWYQKEQPEWC